MSTKKKPEMIGTSINTITGEAFYLCTEIEDANGRFNDDYYTRDGYWVTHYPPEHHVYFVRKE
jgi:hypothetical protein